MEGHPKSVKELRARIRSLKGKVERRKKQLDRWRSDSAFGIRYSLPTEMDAFLRKEIFKMEKEIDRLSGSIEKARRKKV